MNPRKTAGMMLRVGLSAGLLILVFRLVDNQHFVDLLNRMNVTLFVAGVSIYLLTVVLSALRWQLVLRSDGVNVGFRHLAEINLVGTFFTTFLPTALGGDVARMYELSRHDGRDVKAVASVLMDRIFGLVSLVAISVLAVTIGHQHVGHGTVPLVVAGVVVALALFWFAFFSRRVMKRLSWVFGLPFGRRFEERARALYSSMRRLQQQKGLVASTIALSLGLQGVEVLSVILIAMAIDIQIASVLFFVFVPLIWLVTMLPFSLNGLGLREGAFTFFFGLVGVAPAEAVALSLLVYSCRLLVGLSGGVVFLLRSFHALRSDPRLPVDPLLRLPGRRRRNVSHSTG